MPQLTGTDSLALLQAGLLTMGIGPLAAFGPRSPPIGCSAQPFQRAFLAPGGQDKVHYGMGDPQKIQACAKSRQLPPESLRTVRESVGRHRLALRVARGSPASLSLP